MSDLVEFLLARIAEDEAVVHEPHESVRVERCKDMDRIEWDDSCGYARLGVGRVLAECEAKRRIVEREMNSQTPITYRREFVLRDLAGVYADHPDYRDEWQP